MPFPTAQKAFIEETLGVTRPSAIPPNNQIPKESSINTKKTNLFKAYPGWFKKDSISEVEKNFVLNIHKSYFKIEEYVEIRNKLIEMHESTGGYLPVSSILGVGESFNGTLRIYDFLEDNKIINFEIELNEILENIDCDDASVDDGKCLDSDKNTSLNSNNNSDKNKNDVEIHEKYLERSTLENSTCSCGSPAVYFTSDLVFVCEPCFLLGKYPPVYTQRNFHKITDRLLSALWTKKEEYILLRNIERVGDDWTRVCDGLDKTVEQCIFHFIKMSIIDDSDNFPSLPFSQVPNPVSTLVAFVCSLIYPTIATELSKCAIKYLTRPDLMEILLDVCREKGREVFEMEKEKLLKLEKVEIEAMVKRIMFKVDSVNEINEEIHAVKNELEEEREKLMHEIK